MNSATDCNCFYSGTKLPSLKSVLSGKTVYEDKRTWNAAVAHRVLLFVPSGKVVWASTE